MTQKEAERELVKMSKKQLEAIKILRTVINCMLDENDMGNTGWNNCVYYNKNKEERCLICKNLIF